MHFDACIESWKYHHNRDAEQFQCPENTSMLACGNQSLPSLNESIFCPYSFAFHKNVLQIESSAWNLLRLASCTQQNAPWCCMYD